MKNKDILLVANAEAALWPLRTAQRRMECTGRKGSVVGCKRVNTIRVPQESDPPPPPTPPFWLVMRTSFLVSGPRVSLRCSLCCKEDSARQSPIALCLPYLQWFVKEAASGTRVGAEAERRAVALSGADWSRPGGKKSLRGGRRRD